MPRLITALLLLILPIAFLGSCGILQQTTCDTVANVLHDTSLFICKLATDTTSRQLVQTNYTQELLDVQLRALSLAPPSSERDALIQRVSLARLQLQR
jgi:hypothetical protein